MGEENERYEAKGLMDPRAHRVEGEAMELLSQEVRGNLAALGPVDYAAAFTKRGARLPRFRLPPAMAAILALGIGLGAILGGLAARGGGIPPAAWRADDAASLGEEMDLFLDDLLDAGEDEYPVILAVWK